MNLQPARRLSSASAAASAGRSRCASPARAPDKLALLVAEIEAAGGSARSYQADATEEQAVEDLFARAEADLGPPELVVYNASGRNNKSILDMEAAEFEMIWRSSCLGGMIVGREAAKGMVARGQGTILFTGGRSSRLRCRGCARASACTRKMPRLPWPPSRT
mgnify:CR=1 FL=1